MHVHSSSRQKEPISQTPSYKLLNGINSPEDLKKIPLSQLTSLAHEIRRYLLETVSRQGGHLASNLGTVELTIALHYCYNAPKDVLIWDVGHQAYTHKILTGRREQFCTLRQLNGISGFPRSSESPYDAVSTGHASTSLSIGMGMAIARDLCNQKHEVVAIIGDGSLSGGLAFEGLNNLGAYPSLKMAVVLNDNRMSISRNVGALSRYLTRLITDRRFNRLKNDIWELLGSLSNVGRRIRELVHRIDEAVKHTVIPGKLFEDMGLRYFGPVDGHNITEMIEIFQFVKDSVFQPALIHVITTKGKGYEFAENNATKFHGINRFSLTTGSEMQKTSNASTYSEIFGNSLVQIATRRSDIVAITAAMPDGTGLSAFREKFPNRFFDVGIAEEHAIAFAAGLARKGLTPVVAIYSTFLQRSYDQLIHDLALDQLHVVVCIDRAGLVGEDGPTHHGVFDLSFLRSIPGVVIMAPRDEVELRNMLYSAIVEIKGPVFIRYPRGTTAGINYEREFELIPLFQPQKVRTGDDCALVAIGEACNAAEKACELLAADKIEATLINARFAKPLDEDFYRDLFSRHSIIVTVEYNVLAGAFGSALLELAASFSGQPPRITQLGIPDRFIEHGSLDALYSRLKLDASGIAASVRQIVSRHQYTSCTQ